MFFDDSLKCSILLDVNDKLNNPGSNSQIKAKKLYELKNFSMLVKEESNKIGGVDRVVDIGCGLVKYLIINGKRFRVIF